MVAQDMVQVNEPGPHNGRRSPDTPKVLVPAIVNAVAIIRHLRSYESRQGVTAIAQELGLSASSCFNILKTLAAFDILDFDPATRGYRLGAGLAALAGPGSTVSRLREHLTPAMQGLAGRYDLTVGLWEVRDTRPVLVSLCETVATMRIHLTLGQEMPPLAGAVGRWVAISKGFGRDAVAKVLASARWGAALTADNYISDLADAAQRGYSVDADHYLLGVTSLAAPLYDHSGKLCFCISGTTLSARLSPEIIAKIGKALAELAARNTPASLGIDAQDRKSADNV